MTDWVVADWHFGHYNIMDYCKRPWSSVDRMDNDLVKLHNSVVQPGDRVFVIGDVTLKGPDRKSWLKGLMEKMNGRKILVFGNHDEWNWQHYLDVGFESCHTYLAMANTYLGDQGLPYTRGPLGGVRLCHDPAWAQDSNYLWICGHLHNNTFPTESHIAIVSVEVTEYKPVKMADLIERCGPESKEDINDILGD